MLVRREICNSLLQLVAPITLWLCVQLRVNPAAVADEVGALGRLRLQPALRLTRTERLTRTHYRRFAVRLRGSRRR